MSLNKFNYIFFSILIIHLILSGIFEHHWILYISKPLIMISLIIHFIGSGLTNLRSFQKIFLIGMLFSLAGDILLLNESNFLYGLAAFLLTQIAYSIAFYTSQEAKTGWVAKKPLVIIPILIYPAGLILYLYPHLNEMLYPVMMYALVVTVMLILAVNRLKTVRFRNFLIVLTGASLFIVSDSILAIQKFIADFFLGSIFVILTYGLAQYLLTIGMKEEVDEDYIVAP